MTQETNMNSAEAQILTANMDHIRSDMKYLRDMLQSVTQNLQVLPAIQQSQQYIQHEMQRGSDVMTNHENRLQGIERDMPGLKELRRWVIGGLLAGLAMIGTALFKLVIVDIPRYQVQQPIQLQQHKEMLTCSSSLKECS